MTDERKKTHLLQEIDALEDLLREHYYEYEQMLANHQRDFLTEDAENVWGESGDIYNYKQLWIEPLEQELKAAKEQLEQGSDDEEEEEEQEV